MQSSGSNASWQNSGFGGGGGGGANSGNGVGNGMMNPPMRRQPSAHSTSMLRRNLSSKLQNSGSSNAVFSTSQQNLQQQQQQQFNANSGGGGNSGMGNAVFSNFQNRSDANSGGGLMRRFMSTGGNLNQAGLGRSGSSARMVTSTSVNNTPMLSALNRHPQMHSTSALNQFSTNNNNNNNNNNNSTGGSLPISSFLSKNKQRSSGSLNTMGNDSNNMGMNNSNTMGMNNSSMGNSSFSGSNSMNARLLASMDKSHQQQQHQNSGGGNMRHAQSMSAMNSFRPSNPIPNNNNNNNIGGNNNNAGSNSSIGNRLFPNGLVSAVSTNSMQQQQQQQNFGGNSNNNMFLSNSSSSSNMMPSKYSQSSGNLGMMRSSSSRSMSSAVQSNMARLMGGGSGQMNNSQGNNSFGQQKQPNTFMAMLQKQEQQQNNSSNMNNMGMNMGNSMDGGMSRKRSHSQTDLSPMGPISKMQRSLSNATARKNTAKMSTDSLLHSSCKLYPKTKVVLESALAFDPEAIRRSVPLIVSDKKEKKEDEDNTNSNESQADSNSDADQKPPETESADGVEKLSSSETKTDESKDKENKKSYRSTEWYSYPFNIAMKHGAGLDVLQFLAKEGPDVLAQPDGDEEGCALGIALSMAKPSVDVVRLILAANPETRSVGDRRSNYPLHMAVRAPMLDASPEQRLEIVSLVYSAYSQALEKRNFRGETPLDIAVRSPFSCDEVVDFLQQKCAPEESAIMEEAPLL